MRKNINLTLRPAAKLCPQGWMNYQKVIVALIMVIFIHKSSEANTCQGRFINPISDICWSCLMPISIGSFNIGKSSEPKKRDTKNPSAPICMCVKGRAIA